MISLEYLFGYLAVEACRRLCDNLAYCQPVNISNSCYMWHTSRFRPSTEVFSPSQKQWNGGLGTRAANSSALSTEELLKDRSGSTISWDRTPQTSSLRLVRKVFQSASLVPECGVLKKMRPHFSSFMPLNFSGNERSRDIAKRPTSPP